MRWVVCLVSLCVVSSSAAAQRTSRPPETYVPPQAEPEPEPEPEQSGAVDRRLSLAVEQRVALGFDQVSDLTLSLTGAGADLRIAPTLTLRGLLMGMVPVGTTEDGDAADAGFGGELSLRMVPWPDLMVRPHLWWGAGLFFFAEPFLPGGTRYDFIIGFGGGLDVSLTERLVLGANAHVTHLSNGQGLGDHNPAYDGIAFALSLAFALAPRAELPGVWDDHPPREGGRERWVPGVSVDGFVGELGEELLAGGRLDLSQRLARPLVAVLDVDAGSFAKEAYAETGLALVAHLGPTSLAARVAHRWWAGIRTWAVTLQGEWHMTPEVSLVAMGHHERPSAFDDTWRAGAGLRAYPLESLMFELGVGFEHLDRIGDETFEGDTSDPYVGLEWQLPLDLPDLQLSLFVERRISTANTLGLRGSWGVGDTLRDRDRRESWRRLR